LRASVNPDVSGFTLDSIKGTMGEAPSMLVEAVATTVFAVDWLERRYG